MGLVTGIGQSKFGSRTRAVGFLISGSCMLQMKAKEICEVLRADTVLSKVYWFDNAALLVDTHY